MAQAVTPTRGRADTPEKPLAAKGEQGWSKLRTSTDARLASLETMRYTWWVHWRELAEYILPRRYKWLITPNQWNRGSPINQRIIDNTATMAARTLASGMMSGITSPSRPWFRLTVTDSDIAENSDVREWLDDCVGRMQEVMAGSNYYTAKAIQYFDLAVFGTAPMLIYEDIGKYNSKVISCFNPCAGEYFCAAGANFTVDTLYRKFTMTINQVVQEFGLENCSPTVQTAFKQQGSGADREIVIAHAVEPNPEFIAAGGPGNGAAGKNKVPNHFQFQEIFWEYGSSSESALRVQGFLDQPFSCPRWDTTGNDAYGRSPGMDALGDTKQLQVEQKRKAQAIDKMVNPPMTASVAMKNEPASLNPGAVTYVGDLAGNGFKPAFQIMPPIAELKIDIEVTQKRIKDTFFNDLFLMISNLDTVRSATEIDARREEKLVLLGPVLERFNTEGLDPDIKRIFRIMMRNGLFKAPPPIMAGAALKAEYVSVLADQQRAATTTSIERLFAFVGSINAVKQDAIDKLDTDATIEIYGENLRVPAKILVSGQKLAAIRNTRAQQAQAAAAQQQTQAMVEGAQTLSQTDVGGGQNALQAVLHGLPAGGQGALNA